jgi:hypothetical protein
VTDLEEVPEPERTHLCAWCNEDTPESELTYDEETDDFYCGSCINLKNLVGRLDEEDDDTDTTFEEIDPWSPYD